MNSLFSRSQRLGCIAILALGFLGLTGCASLQESPSLSASLVNVQPLGATIFETQLGFTLRLSNESNEPLTIEGAVYKIHLNGLYVGKGMAGESVTVPRLDSALQEVTVNLQNIKLATQLRELIEARVYDYRIECTLYAKQGSRSRRVSLTETGTLDLNRFAPGSFRNLEDTDFDSDSFYQAEPPR